MIIKGKIKYKETGIPYCPQIPESWNVKRLKFVGKSIIGITYNPTQVTDAENGKLVLRSSNVQNGLLSFEDNVYVNTEISDKHLSKEGDILICARNGSAHLVGKCAYIPKEYEGLTFGAFMLMFRSEFGKFMYYVFNSNLFKSQTGLFKTSTINQLTSDTINNLFVALPETKQEQEKIATFLNTKTAEIDKIISKKQKLIDCLKEERNAIINQSITKGVNLNAKMKNSGVEWLGDIPHNWVLKKLKYVALVQPSSVDKKSVENEQPVLLCNYVDVYKNEFITDDLHFMNATAKDEQIAKFKLKLDDVLITKDSETPKDIAVPALVKIEKENLLCGYHLAQIRANKKEVIGEYLFRLFQSKNFNSNFEMGANGITRYGLGLETIKSVLIPLPNIEEQFEIVAYIQKQSQRIDFTISRIEQEIELISEYKTALINEVVTGKMIIN